MPEAVERLRVFQKATTTAITRTLSLLTLGPMMTFWFCTMDACKRQGYTATPLGAFLSSGGAALVASSRP